jgi:hypothetical protein
MLLGTSVLSAFTCPFLSFGFDFATIGLFLLGADVILVGT